MKPGLSRNQERNEASSLNMNDLKTYSLDLREGFGRRFALLFCVLAIASLATSKAQEVADLVFDCSLIEDGDLAQARKETEKLSWSDGKDLRYHSTKEETPQPFVGKYTPPELPEDKKGRYLYGMAIFSDDGSAVSLNGEKIHDKLNKGQALPELESSFHVLPILLAPGKEVNLEVEYSNIYFGTNEYDPDIDGVSLFLFLLPMELKEAWSDQIKDVEVNGLPDKTGLAEKPYILMGAKADGKGHGQLKLSSALSEDIRDRVLFRFYRDGQVQAGSSTYEKNGSIVRVRLDSIVNAQDKDYTIVSGFDENKDGELQNEEVMIYPELTYDEQNKIPITYKVVGQARYNDSKKELNDDANGFFTSRGFTQASRLLNAYISGTKPNGNVEEVAIRIARDEPSLTHPVGVKFTPKRNPGVSEKFIFPKNDPLTEKVVDSTTMNVWLSKEFRERKDEVRKKMREIFDEVGFGGPVEVTFRWDLQGSMSFKSRLDADLFLALNNVDINVKAVVKVHRSGQVVDVKLYGAVTDLYDFDHDNTYLGMKLPMRASEMQAGYPSLGAGGKVFKTKLVLDGNDPWRHPDLDPFEFF